MTARVSVVVPVYNPPIELFEGCLESVASQELTGDGSVELIVVYDGAPDESARRAVERIGSRVAVREVEIQHLGVSAARNAGTEAATGEWLAFLDADDRLDDGALAGLLDFGVDHACDVVLGDHTKVYPDGGTEVCSYDPSDIFPSADFAERARRDVLNPGTTAGSAWAKLYRLRGAAWQIPRFDESIAVGEDTEFVFRCLLSTERVGYLHRCVYLYQRNAASAVRRWRADYVDRIVSSLNVMRADVERLPDAARYRSALVTYEMFHLLLILVHYLFNPSAPWNGEERRRAYAAVLGIPIFFDGLRHFDPRDFSLARRVALISLKYRVYPLSLLIGYVRQRQMA